MAPAFRPVCVLTDFELFLFIVSEKKLTLPYFQVSNKRMVISCSNLWRFVADKNKPKK